MHAGEALESLSKNQPRHMNREEKYKQNNSNNKPSPTKDALAGRLPRKHEDLSVARSTQINSKVNSRVPWCTLVMSAPGQWARHRSLGLAGSQASLKMRSRRSHQETPISKNKVDGTWGDMRRQRLTSGLNIDAHKSRCTQHSCESPQHDQTYIHPYN